MDKNLFEIHNLRCTYDKDYQEGKSRVVLEIKDLEIPQGKKIFIVGESGIGKSTILETLGLMNNTIVPGDSEASFRFADGTDLLGLWRKGDETTLADFRLKYYSFIFQSTNLMRNFTAYENVMFTRMLQGYSTEECRERTRMVLEQLGLDHVDRTRMAHELSGGQQQRLAFARAILPDFTVLFGDEPTGNLDGENAVRVMQILRSNLDMREGASAVIVSHDMPLAMRFADVIIKISRRVRPRKHDDDEEIAYGYIDSSCSYHRDSDGNWTNGIDTYKSDDFNKFLRQII